MKRRNFISTVFIAIAGMALAAGTVTAPDDEVLVFILAGQSNMLGWGMKKELPPELRTFPDNIEYHSYVGGKRPFNHSNRFGPEITFAHEIAKQFPDRKIMLIKDATGATSLAAWAPEYIAENAAATECERGPLYSMLWDNIRKHTAGRNIRYMGVLWMQGERDSKFDFSANAYAENLATLIAAFRKDCGEPELPFVFGQVNPPVKKFRFVDTVRKQQAQTASDIPNVAMVQTDELSKRSDNVHYNTAGQIELGKRFAKIMIGELTF